MSGRFLQILFLGLGALSALLLDEYLPRQFGPSHSSEKVAKQTNFGSPPFQTEPPNAGNRMLPPWKQRRLSNGHGAVTTETGRHHSHPENQATEDVLAEIRENEIKAPLMTKGGGPNSTAVEHYGLTTDQIHRMKDLQQRIAEKARQNFHERMTIVPNVEGCAYVVEYIRDNPFHEALKNDFLHEMGGIAGPEFAQKSSIWLKSDFMGSYFDHATHLRFYIAPDDPEILQPLEIAPAGHISIADGTPIVRVEHLHRGEPLGSTSEVTIGELKKMNIVLPQPQEEMPPAGRN